MNKELPEHIPIEICDLANQLHGKRGLDLTIEIPPKINSKTMESGDLWEIGSNILKFKSLQARNHCTAIYRLKALENQPNIVIFSEAQKLWRNEISHEDFASGRLIALAFTNMDIVKTAMDAIGDYSYGDILTLIGATLPYLPNKVAIDAVTLLSMEGEENSSIGIHYFFNGINRLIKENQDVSELLYASSKENLSDKNTRIYNTAITSIASSGQHKKAIRYVFKDIQTNQNRLVNIALRTLGDLSIYWIKENKLQEEALQTIREMMSHEDHEIRVASFQALSYSAYNLHELIGELIDYSGIDESIKLKILSNFIMSNLKEIKDTPNFPKLLLLLSGRHEVDLPILDHTLSLLIDGENHDSLVYETLTQWIKKNQTKTSQAEKLSKNFSQTISSLSTSKLLPDILTNWLNADEISLAIAFSDLIGDLWTHNFRTLSFSSTIVDQLSDNDFTYLSRRLLAWTFHEEALISLTLSLLNTENAKHRSFSHVRELLIELGKNFPESVLKELSDLSKVVNGDKKLLLQNVKDEVTNYSDKINNLPNLSELRAPVQLRRAIRLKRINASRNMVEQSRKSSILHSLAKQIPLKSGTGSFSTYNGELGPVNRLASFSTSVSLPALYIVDPLNDEINRLFLRSIKRDAE